MAIVVNKPIPEFEANATGGVKVTNTSHNGNVLVLYFYPKDNTPGCTDEGAQFRDLYAEFQKRHCEIYGLSRDSVRSHEGFKAKMTFPFDLLSDEEELACTMFGVMKMKNMYGKKVRGIERSTFVIDANGRVCKEWRGVKVAGHAQEVLDFVKTLS